MRSVKEYNKIDAIADHEDVIQVRIQKSIAKGCKTLYVDVNGETILRIGWIVDDITIENET